MAIYNSCHKIPKRTKSKSQSSIISFLTKEQAPHIQNSSKLQNEKNIPNSSDLDDIDELFERHQIDVAQNEKTEDEEEEESIVFDNDEDDNELTPEEEIDEAIKDSLKRKAYIAKHYKFKEYKGNNSYYQCIDNISMN